MAPSVAIISDWPTEDLRVIWFSDALRTAGCSEIFEWHASGGERSRLAAALVSGIELVRLPRRNAPASSPPLSSAG